MLRIIPLFVKMQFKDVIGKHLKQHYTQSLCIIDPKHPVRLNALVCIISDDQDHNGTAIHKVIEVIMSFLKAKILVKHVHYFSDGAANI